MKILSDQKLYFLLPLLMAISFLLISLPLSSCQQQQGQQQQQVNYSCLPYNINPNASTTINNCTDPQAISAGCVTCVLDNQQNEIQCKTCQTEDFVPVRDEFKCLLLKNNNPPQTYAGQVFNQIQKCQNVIQCSPLCVECINDQTKLTTTKQTCQTCAKPYYPLGKHCVVDCQFNIYNHTGQHGFSYMLNQANDTELIMGQSTCVACSSLCYTCTYVLNTSNIRCNECVYSKQRYSNQNVQNHFIRTKNNSSPLTGGYNCTAATDRLSTTLTLRYVVSPDGANACAEPCASSIVDSLEATYFTFKKMVVDITAQNINFYKEIVVNIVLVKGSSGQSTFFFDQNWFVGDTLNWKLRLFERSSATVTMQPADSSNCGNLVSTRCFDITNGQLPTIVWRNSYLFFHVTKSLTIQNIVFRGGDLNINSGGQTANTEICGNMMPANQCQPSSLNFNQSTYFSSDPTQPMWSRPNGIFHLDWLIDYTSASIPTLQITNCQFNNFLAHQYAKSLISFQLAGNIVIDNVTFSNNYFRYGLITNSLDEKADRQGFYAQEANQQQRNTQHLFTSRIVELSCKSFGHGYSSSTNCHTLTIKNSQFDKFNPYLMTKGKKVVFEEGMALALQNVDGPIVLKNNSFTRFVTFVNFEFSNTNQHSGTYNCAKETLYPHFQLESGQTLYDTPNDVAATSRFKLYIDKHVRRFLNYKREIGSVIHIKNLTQGLIMYNNTFDQNVGTGGVNLLVEGFKDAANYPIVLEHNVFSNNFAYQFSPSFALVTFEQDLVQMQKQCTGVFIHDNQIFGNAGCNQAFGNAIISCEPNHPNIVPPNSDITNNDQGTSQKQFAKDEKTYYTIYTAVLADGLQIPTNTSLSQVKFTEWIQAQMDIVPNYTPLSHPSKFTDYSTYYSSDNSATVPNFRATISSNLCYNNYAILSNCFYLQGFQEILFQNNSITGNSVPIPEILSNTNLLPRNAFYTLISGSISGGGVPYSTETRTESVKHTYAKESSPLLIRLSNFVQIKDSNFSNNSAVFTGDFYFGQAITLDRITGAQNVTIDNCIFTNHTGLPTQIVPSSSDGFIDHFCSFPLISYSFWYTPNFQNYQVSISQKANQSSKVLVTNSKLSDNLFNLKYKLDDGRVKADEVRLFDEVQLNMDTWYRQQNLNSGYRFTYKYDRLNQYENHNQYSSFLFKHFLPQDTNFLATDDQNIQDNIRETMNLIKEVMLSLENLTITNNTNSAGTCLLETGLNSFYGKNLLIQNNKVSSQCQLFNNNRRYVNQDYIDSGLFFGGVICGGEWNSLNQQGLYSYDLNNITLLDNQGIIMNLRQSDNLINLNQLDIRNNNCSSLPLILIYKYSKISAQNILISNNYYSYGAFYIYASEQISLNQLNITDNIGTMVTGLFLDESEVQSDKLVFLNNSFTATTPSSINSSLFNQQKVVAGQYNQSITIGLQIMWNSKITINSLIMGQNYGIIPGFYCTMCEIVIDSIDLVNLTTLVQQTAFSWIVQQSKLTVSGGIIKNCQCDGCYGGLIVSVNSDINLYNLEIFNITSKSAGVLLANASKTLLQGVNFHNIIVETICSLMDIKLGQLTINGSQFLDNQATDMTISLSSSKFSAQNSLFVGNKGTQRTKNIYAKSCDNTFILNQVTFVDYKTDSESAIASFIYGLDIMADIKGCNFNGAYSQMGAVYIESQENKIMINSSSFADAILSGQDGGGGIYALTKLELNNSLFRNNSNSIKISSQSSCVQLESSEELIMTNNTFLDSDNYQIIVKNSKNIFIDNVYINDTRVGSQYISGGLFFTGTTPLTVLNSYIQGMRGMPCGGGMQIYFDSSFSFGISLLSYTLNNVTFNQCKANNGGGLCLQNTDQSQQLVAQVINSTFYKNDASYGGGIFYDCYQQACNLSIKQSTFQKNYAVYGGGGLYFNGFNPTFDSLSSFSDNTAFYGPHIGAYPIRMEMVSYPSTSSKINQTILSTLFSYVKNTSTSDSSTNILRIMQDTDDLQLSRRNLEVPQQNITLSTTETIETQFVSGQVSSVPPMFILIDEYGQHVNIMNNSNLYITTNNQNVKITSGSAFQAVNGTYIAYPLIVQFEPGNNVVFEFSTDGIKQVPGRTYPNLTNLSATHNVSGFVRKCIENEQWTDYDTCETCKQGYMNTQPNVRGLNCQKCPQTSACLGSGLVGPDGGFWRIDKLSSNFLECENSAACLGAWANSTAEQAKNMNTSSLFCKDGTDESYSTFCLNGWCASKYKGNLCNTCQDGFAKSNKIYCVSCSDNPLYYVIIGLVLLAVVLFVVITIRDTLQEKKYQPDEPHYNRSSVLMKIILNYFQLIAIVATFDFKWPSEVKQTLQAQQQVMSSTAEVFSFDCFLNKKASSTTDGELTAFFMKLLIISICPILFSFVAGFVWMIIYFIRHRVQICQFRNILQANITTSVIIILFLLHTTIVETTIRSLRCKNLSNDSDPLPYMYEDYEVQCWTGTHLKWVILASIPSLAVWGVVAPAMAFLILFKNTAKFDNEEFKRSYGFLYLGYKKRKYFWELIILYRKLAMIFISVFMSTFTVYVQAICVLGVGFISYLAQINNRPFIEDDLNNIETKSLISATFTLYCGLFYLSGDLDGNSSYVLFILILSSNIIFGVLWFIAYTKEMFRKFSNSKFVEKYFAKRSVKSEDSNSVKEDMKVSYFQLTGKQGGEDSNKNNGKEDQNFDQQTQLDNVHDKPIASSLQVPVGNQNIQIPSQLEIVEVQQKKKPQFRSKKDSKASKQDDEDEDIEKIQLDK